MPYAFRCRQCGHLHPAGHAGICAVPHSCVVCKAGLRFDPTTGIKTFHSDNWEVLADATPQRLAELGLNAADVEKHVPDPEKDRLANLERAKVAHAQLVEKEQTWKSKPFAQWEAEANAIEAKVRALEAQKIDPADVVAYAKQHDELSKLKQQFQAIMNAEFTERDAQHRDKLHSECIAVDGRAAVRAPKSMIVSLQDRMGIGSKAN